jgi:hypothetical protein
MLFNGTQIEGTCEMVDCANKLDTDEMSRCTLYAPTLNRNLEICEDCKDEYENLMAYGRPDMGTRWLDTTQHYHRLNIL